MSAVKQTTVDCKKTIFPHISFSLQLVILLRYYEITIFYFSHLKRETILFTAYKDTVFHVVLTYGLQVGNNPIGFDLEVINPGGHYNTLLGSVLPPLMRTFYGTDVDF